MSEALSEEKQKVNSSKRNTTSNGDLANINTNAI